MLLGINGKEVMPYDDCVIEGSSGHKIRRVLEGSKL